MLNWANSFSIFCFLDNHGYNFQPHKIECLLAAGCHRSVEAAAGHTLDQLDAFCKQQQDWIFGHLSYDLKNEIDQLSSENFDGIAFPDLFFFVPEIVVELSATEIRIGTLTGSSMDVYDAIRQSSRYKGGPTSGRPNIQPRISSEEYLQIISRLQQHILYGDCYEINFCQEFFAENCVLDPLSIHHSLSEQSPNPFSALYKLNGKYLFCASPERYLKKKGTKLISQPIKGTSARFLQNEIRDIESRTQLEQSEKDRAENVMVVDLVRNDLSRVCIPGSVRVDELFGIYSFPQVHQLVSTVEGELKPGIGLSEIIRASFPMGSMTGAPKKRVMELIERYEKTRRGIFSGAVGYVEPGGDFDFNVVIRSLLYNQANLYLSYQVGSGITFYSNAREEYEECMLKAAAIKKVLAG